MLSTGRNVQNTSDVGIGYQITVRVLALPNSSIADPVKALTFGP
jgi:hypothetical protein